MDLHSDCTSTATYMAFVQVFYRMFNNLVWYDSRRSSSLSINHQPLAHKTLLKKKILVLLTDQTAVDLDSVTTADNSKNNILHTRYNQEGKVLFEGRLLLMMFLLWLNNSIIIHCSSYLKNTLNRMSNYTLFNILSDFVIKLLQCSNIHNNVFLRYYCNTHNFSQSTLNTGITFCLHLLPLYLDVLTHQNTP